MKVVVGRIADELGLAARQEIVQGVRGPELRFNAWSSKPSEYRTIQPHRIPLDWCHDGGQLGQVAYLERSAGRGLYAVATVRDDVSPAVAVRVADEMRSVPVPLFFSAETSSTQDYRDIELRSLALTPSPAQTCAEPVTFLHGDGLAYADAPRIWGLADGFEKNLLFRAAASCADRRRHPGPLVIHGDRPAAPVLELRRANTVECRAAAVVDVSRAKRELDLIIAPAERPTTIFERARSFIETFAHGAFAGAERNPEKVRVNRDHERARTIGKALHLDPWAEEGLTGTVRLAKIKDADEALAMIDEDLLGVSAGFAIDAGGDEWHGTKQRRIRRALLDHIALVPQPAYEAATVTAVRSDLH